VLALSIIYIMHISTTLIERERRRSNKTNTNVVIARKFFGDDVRKKLFIFTFIDDYNYKIGGVDIGSQYRIEYETHKSIFRN
jgi:hypothetical protein